MILIDRSIPRRVAEELRATGADVLWLEDRFKHDAPDEEWLREAGRMGWIVVTRDKKIRTNRAARRAIEESQACVIVFEQQTVLRTQDYVAVLRTLLPTIEGLPTDAPAIYAIARGGQIRQILPRPDGPRSG